jgi:hypothetical protein
MPALATLSDLAVTGFAGPRQTVVEALAPPAVTLNTKGSGLAHEHLRAEGQLAQAYQSSGKMLDVPNGQPGELPTLYELTGAESGGPVIMSTGPIASTPL